jgi:hypothetical protein
MGVTHTMVSGKSDGADASLVRPSDWNAAHTISNIDQVMNGQTAIAFTAPFINGVGLTDTYMQCAWQNKSTGANASTDIVVTADNGTDATWYMDLGINGSGYSVGTWTVSGPGDAYLLNASGIMTIGTLTSGKAMKVHTGGSLAANIRAEFNDTYTEFKTPIVGGQGAILAMYSGMYLQ